jgi:uncharacterized SAM-binding protein YcdF (DUF218 family)
LITILKAIGPPGSVPFIGFCGLIALVVTYVWPKNARLARAWLAFVVIGHLTLAVPVVANGIADHLPRVVTADATEFRDIEIVFVFDGDNRRGRVSSAAQLSAASPTSVIWILGGEPWLVDALAETGVARSRIKQDNRSSDTRGQMADVRRLAAQHPAGRTAIVASRLQMPRVAELSRADNVSSLLVASPVDVEPPTSGWRVYLPTYYALRVSRDAIYEHVALAYYGWRGWK